VPLCYSSGLAQRLREEDNVRSEPAKQVLRRASVRGAIALILLGLTGSFIVDWVWFGEVGYLGVFWHFLKPKLIGSCLGWGQPAESKGRRGGAGDHTSAPGDGRGPRPAIARA
jgi:hypothetical protein